MNHFTNDLEIHSIDVASGQATVDLTLVESIDYNFLDETSLSRVNHVIELSNINEKWLITSDTYSNELRNLYDYGTDFTALESELVRREEVKQTNH